ncbi:MAG: hypothetical protein DRJ15_15545 [Bacteroidetes bacterium]|nr:MAG: hypothetical protein DRJ15_15545 [Bacteroidota bacterium]
MLISEVDFVFSEFFFGNFLWIFKVSEKFIVGPGVCKGVGRGFGGKWNREGEGVIKKPRMQAGNKAFSPFVVLKTKRNA